MSGVRGAVFGGPAVPAWPRRLVGLLLVAAIGATGAAAQTPFALQALGQNIDHGDARDMGRGGWGMADRDTLTPGTRNPAALADLNFLGLFFNGYSEATTTSGGGLERTTRRAYLPEIRLGVPLRSRQVVLHGGLCLKRSMQFETVDPIELEHFGEPVLGWQDYRRDGTLYTIPLGLSWRATSGLALSGAFNFVRGTIQDVITETYTEPLGNYYLANVREQKDRMTGNNFTLALLWDGWRALQLGAAVSTGYDLTMQRTVALGGVAERATDRFTGAMPPEYRAGLLLNLPRTWRFGADLQLMPYERFTGRPDWEPDLRDEWTVAAGFERPLVFRAHGRGYQKPWRFGYQQRQWAHTIGGAPVREHAISMGTGFPFRNRLGTLDLSLSYVWIGSERDNGWRSNSLRLGLSINGLERLVL